MTRLRALERVWGRGDPGPGRLPSAAWKVGSARPAAGLRRTRPSIDSDPAPVYCEYPVEVSLLAAGLTTDRLTVDDQGLVRSPDRTGWRTTVHRQPRVYLQRVEIRVGGRVVYATPMLC